MKLKDLLRGVAICSATADMETEITGVSYDSRCTQAGDLFVAVSGFAVDGHKFVPMAAEKGAVCAVCEHAVESAIPCVVVENTRRALAVIGENWFDHPAREMTMVGVTGTNGKTTSTYLIKSILEKKAGAKVGLIGTIQNMIGDQVIPTERTTPESFELQRLFRQMADAGCTHVVMEVSSHALALDRVYGIPFAVGVFTNLTQDHLDFHKTMEHYCDAKALLFRQCDTAVYNADDPWHERLLRGSTCRRFSYGVESEADLRAKNVALTAGSVAFDAEADTEWAQVEVGIPGPFTVYNTLDAMAACYNLGVSLQDCADALREGHGVKGRMEVIPTPGKGYTVLNDYAHTPDALENVLTAVKGFAKGRTVVLFGCGGDRDRTKRPIMGGIAARLADFCIVTSDNPRTEEPQAIIDDILAGMAGCDHYVTIPDRVEAIHWAMDNAKDGDVIVLAGKGHEDYQEIHHVHYPMDERVIVAEHLIH
ncbi:MAG: UDP-N-acetylmuramoyl-L-alanyl-D-glutamate--2,6-diaminopimelate ligase [Oscillospiraceae bacterium]|nr:UDP-N-acetylmuramoyl-L-alanyl-D-glutamate--2,6-diaminopimelate ligase [Oscillospiraceae bacterium]